MELRPKMITIVFLLGAICALSACNQPAGDSQTMARPTAVSIDESLLEIAKIFDLPIIDVSVPFERLSEAPARLLRVADALHGPSPGLFVLRYRDDTLRHTNHIFAISKSRQDYIEMTSLPTEQLTTKQSIIQSANYDQVGMRLTIQTENGKIRLTPADVTSVGA